ncbi:phosphotransferase family protein [Ochrobactrum sp. XJ1]|nr:phosphotransferase family protein [Ochrobactrum sp. XJ1]
MIDQVPLRNYLEKTLGKPADSFSFTKFEGGQSNPTYLVSSDTTKVVLRKRPAGVILPSAHAVDREFRVQQALAGSDIPVSRMISYCDDTSVLPEAFYLMDFIPGRTFNHVQLPEVAADERGTLYDEMVDVAAKLHSVDWKAAGLEGFGRAEGYLERQVRRWTAQYEASRTSEDDGPMSKIADWLREKMPLESPVSIVHGDYRLGNLIYAPDKNEVAAVLDWELATIGHPWADFAYTCHFYHMGDKDGPQFALEVLPAGIPNETEALARYCKTAGISEIPRWPYYLVFALFRSAAILAGVYSRALQGNAADAHAREVGSRYRNVAKKAWHIAQTSKL